METHPIPISNHAVAMVPVSGMSDIMKLGEAAAKSGIFGNITSSAGSMIMLTCYQERLSPVDYNNKYHTIDGKPTKRADRVLAEFRQNGGKYRILEASDTRAAIEFSYDGNKLVGEMTLEKAKETGIAIGKNGIKDNWRRTPAQMLFARAVTNGVRMVMPEILCGMYSPEEVAEFDDANPLPVEPTPVPQPIEIPSVDVLQSSRCEDVSAIDPSLCPIQGSLFNTPWNEMSNEHLIYALNIDRTKHPEMTDAHFECIKKELEASREEATNVNE